MCRSLKFLLMVFFNINCPRSPQGMTPLELAVRENAENIVEKLCAAGADMMSSSCGEPPLWLALDVDCFNIASILVRHGVDTDNWAPGPDNCSQTLLRRYHSCMSLFKMMTKML